MKKKLKPRSYSSIEDVLAVVKDIESRSGFELISEEAMESMKSRIGDGVFGLKKTSSNSEFRKDLYDLSDEIVRLIMKKMEEIYPAYFKGESWDELSKDEREDVYRFVFGLALQISPEQLRLNIYNKLGGGLD